jgi:RHS repeat-associated protein
VLGLTQGNSEFTYRYDQNGNPTAITDTSGTHLYRYDDLDRLVGVQHDSAPAETVSYDAAGNRTGSAADPAWQYDAAGRLVAAQEVAFEYDRNGNLIRKTAASGTTTYTWDAENRLARVETPDGGVVACKYDPFGRRIEKNVNGAVTTWLYDGNAIVLEMDSSGRMTARYTHGHAADWPLMLERDGQTWFYHADTLGSVVALTHSSGDVVRSYAYDPWGRPKSVEETGPANPFLFAGREYDPETGLYYMRARYYDPAIGRFLSADPLDLPGLLVSGQSPLVEDPLLPQAAAWALRAGPWA